MVESTDLFCLIMISNLAYRIYILLFLTSAMIFLAQFVTL